MPPWELMKAIVAAELGATGALEMSWFQAASVGREEALAAVPGGGSGKTEQLPRSGYGPTARAYAGRYSAEQLRAWAERVERWRRAGHDVYAYFNNDDAGHAVANARELRALLGVPAPGSVAIA